MTTPKGPEVDVGTFCRRLSEARPFGLRSRVSGTEWTRTRRGKDLDVYEGTRPSVVPTPDTGFPGALDVVGNDRTYQTHESKPLVLILCGRVRRACQSRGHGRLRERSSGSPTVPDVFNCVDLTDTGLESEAPTRHDPGRFTLREEVRDVGAPLSSRGSTRAVVGVSGGSTLPTHLPKCTSGTVVRSSGGRHSRWVRGRAGRGSRWARGRAGDPRSR